MKPTIAILCAGLDSVKRGYEIHTRNLFECLKSEASITLYKRDGQKLLNEIPLNTPSRTSPLCQILARCRGTSYYWESIFFALSFVWHAYKNSISYHHILIIEPMVSKTIYHLRKLLPGNPQITFTHGVSMEPQDYINIADQIHEVNPENFNKSIRYNSDKNIKLIPHFINPYPFKSLTDLERSILKKKYNISTQKVALCVSPITKHGKRIDYLLQELSMLPSDWSLLICGNVLDEHLIKEAKDIFKARFINAYVSKEDMLEIYAFSDLFILCSLNEGFGLSIIEAMYAGLPTLLHQCPLFYSIVKDPDQLIPMHQEGALAQKINTILPNEEWFIRKRTLNKKTADMHFIWNAVREDYLKLIG